MASYTMRATVIVPVDVAKLKDGQVVAPGHSVDLPKAYGDHLVSERLADTAGPKAITKAKDGKSTGKAKDTKKSEADREAAERAEAIVTAVSMLDPEKDFDPDKKPEVKAVSDVVGFETTRQEIDAALAKAE